MPILRGDPRDRPIVRHPALPDLPAREDQGLAREADRPPAAVPLLSGHLHAAGRAPRAGPKPSARDLRRAVRGFQPGAARLGREPEICWHRSPRLLRCSAYLGPGGGIDEGGNRWLPSRADFLVPVEALSILFRANFRDILERENLLHLNSLS